ncbi:MAG: hypothetical protein J2P38_09000 [Candidatus Dormibacteraeota bacterium]|nr:hypothetical protein [Candidatus Dormibacteraeota bacterium]
MARASVALLAVLLLLAFAVPRTHSIGAHGADAVVDVMLENPVAARAVTAWEHRPGHLLVPRRSIHLPPDHA